MTNLSYAMFQNTKSDLSDCIDRLEMEGIDSLDDDDLKKVKEMVKLCKQFIELAE